MNTKTKIAIIIVLILLILAGAGLGGYLIYRLYYFSEEKPCRFDALKDDCTSIIDEDGTISLDPVKESTHLSQVARGQEAHWQRGGWMHWNDLEPVKGKIDWEFSDEQQREMQKYGTYLLPVIFPYANWDQDTCHSEEYEAEFDPKKGGTIKVGKPCDMQAYKDFMTAIVERYDGDGIDDMPGLTIPIKYWEILNEPSMQGGSLGGMGEELKFFVGTSEEYVEILKTGYEAIKAADPEAKVVHAGMAGMQQNFQDFWDEVFSTPDIGNYFDIANIHSISTTTEQEDLHVIKFKKYLDKYGLGDKPIWVTEVQIGNLTDRPENTEDFDKLLVRASVFSLAHGAEKLFYIENWLHWNQQKEFPDIDEKEEDIEDKEEEELKEKYHEDKDEFFKDITTDNETHQVYLNLVDKINSFDRVETIYEKYTEGEMDHAGATSEIGQYRFVSGDQTIYVLWGEHDIPSEISGSVKLTDIYGSSRTIDASDISLSDVPIFIKLVK